MYLRPQKSWRWSFICVLLVASANAASPCAATDPAYPRLIAHAGGEIGGLTYTNTLEALQTNYDRGHRFFELDFHWTSDRQLVLIHDWDEQYRSLFLHGDSFFSTWVNRWLDFKVRYLSQTDRPDLASFAQYRLRNKLTQLTIPRLRAWLTEHRDATVISDIKERNADGLAILRTQLGDASRQLIPQVYAFDEFKSTRSAGYPKIILTLYRLSAADSEVEHFVRSHSLWAITMPNALALERKLAMKLNSHGIKVYSHTVNLADQYKALCDRGVYGVHTDTLTLKDIAN